MAELHRPNKTLLKYDNPVLVIKHPEKKHEVKVTGLRQILYLEYV
jgi:hypothetical protein